MTVTPLNADVLAAFDEAQAALAATPTRELLVKTHQLTHQLHAATMVAGDRRESRERRDAARREAVDLREKRGMVDAEILRRAGA